ncbi:MAG: PHP domain-containing protein [Candidatus Nanoarchaeia archaeon]|nr:PHP domain-containing protein [Candidatus Nanoarchaeia archaeon]
MLKADLHIHTNYIQKGEGKYSPKWLIDHMAKWGYEVLAITEHSTLNGAFVKKSYSNALDTYFKFKDYAKEKNILLIPGVERHIEGVEVLILNYNNFEEINTFKDLQKVRQKGGLIIAPHPYYPWGLNGKLEENIKYFDALERTVHYLKGFDSLNEKAEEIAKKYKKTMVANSDAHWKFQLNRNATLIDAEKNIDSILDAIRKNKVEIQTKPLTTKQYFFTTMWVIKSKIRKLFTV